MRKQLDIGVIGCGTGGPAAARFLASQGHRVQILEKVRVPEAVGAGITLQPTGLSILKQLGLLDRVLDSGSRLERLLGTTSAGRTVLDLRYADLDPHYFGVGIHRGSLFSALLESLDCDGVELRTDAPISSVVESERDVTVETEGGDVFRFDLVVIADGARSSLRAKLLPEARVRPYDWGALWAVVRHPAGLFESTLTQVFSGTSRFVGFLPTGTDPVTGERVLSVFWSHPVADMDRFRSLGAAHFRDQVRDLTLDVEPVLEQIEDTEQLLPARYFDVVAPRVSGRRSVFIGDSAHAMSPQLGQGANLALYDAWVLSECVAEAGDVPAALESYTRERLSHLRFYQHATRLLTPFFQSNWEGLGWLRDMTMGPLCRLPFFSRQGLGAMAGFKTGIWGKVPVCRRLDTNG